MKLRFLLFPIALIYEIVIRFRNFLYNFGFYSITGFEYPLIGVGNLSVGGTGKTPHIEYLIRLLNPVYQLATLSRGYGRKSKGFLVVKSTMPVDKAGDEPLQFKNKFPDLKVVLGEKRVKAMMSILASYPHINAVLLDDAYQHRSIKPGLSILLTDYKHLFYKDYMLPVGTLREPASGIKRAHIILVTKTPENATDDSIKRIRSKIKLVPPQSLFFTCMKYGQLNPVNSGYPILQLSGLKELHVIAFSGLARPGNFTGFLKNKSLSLKHVRFSDHHHFTIKELTGIKNKFDQVKGDHKIILTTEKDWMRIVNEPERKMLEKMPVYTLEMYVDFIDPKEKEIFDSKILNYVEKNQPNHIFHRKSDQV